MTYKQSTTLEPINETHCKQTFEWVSTPYIQKAFAINSLPTWETHKKYFPSLTAPDKRTFAIIHHGTHVGNCGLKGLTDNKGELWIYLGEKECGSKGIGSEATRLLIDFGFNELGLEIIYLHVLKSNEPALRLYHKFGFCIASTKSVEWEGRRDIVRMELSREKQ